MRATRGTELSDLSACARCRTAVAPGTIFCGDCRRLVVSAAEGPSGRRATPLPLPDNEARSTTDTSSPAQPLRQPGRRWFWKIIIVATLGAAAMMAALLLPIYVAVALLGAAGVLAVYFWVTASPGPVRLPPLRLPETGEDAIETVRGAIAAVGWVETGSPVLRPSLADSPISGNLLADLLVPTLLAPALESAAAVTAPPEPPGSAMSLLCYPKTATDHVSALVRVSFASDAWGSTVVLEGVSVIRDKRPLRKAMAQLEEAIRRAAR